MKFLNLWQGAAVASLLALGGAQAQTAGVGNYNISGTSASVSQTITVTVPTRFGLHLHLSSWNLDLNNVGQEGGPSCFRAGNHSSALGTAGTGRDFLYGTGANTDSKILSLIAAATYRGDQVTDAANPYSYLGSLNWNNTQIDGQPTGGYPGFYVTGGKLVWKGPIMCSFQTIVQKFANTDGWRFTSSLTDNNATAAAPARPWTLPLYVADRFTNGPIPRFTTVSNGLRLLPGSVNARTLASAPSNPRGAPRTTGGWLDDNILQVILFDGSETNGTYSGTVTYTLGDFAQASLAFCPPVPYTDANNQIVFGTGELITVNGVQRCFLAFDGPNGPDNLNYTPAFR